MKSAVSVTKSKGKILISIDEKDFDGDFNNIYEEILKQPLIKTNINFLQKNKSFSFLKKEPNLYENY